MDPSVRHRLVIGMSEHKPMKQFETRRVAVENRRKTRAERQSGFTACILRVTRGFKSLSAYCGTEAEQK